MAYSKATTARRASLGFAPGGGSLQTTTSSTDNGSPQYSPAGGYGTVVGGYTYTTSGWVSSSSLTTSSGGGGISGTTSTEQALRMSLPPELRNLPVAEVQRKIGITKSRGTGAASTIVNQYKQAGYSQRDSEILAKESEKRRQSFGTGEAQKILGQDRARGTGQLSSRGLPESYIGDIQPTGARGAQRGTTLIQDVKEIGETISRPFTSTFKEIYEPIKKADYFIPPGTRELVARGKTSALKLIESGKQKIEETLYQPDIRLDTAEKNIERGYSQLERDYENYNKKYGGRELPETEYNQATDELQNLENRQSNLEKQYEQISGERKEEIKRQEFEDFPFTFVKRGFTEAVKTPLYLGEMALTPVKTVKETISFLGEIPEAIKERPATTLGGIAGSLVGFELGGLALGKAIKTAGTIARTKTINPRVSTSVEFSDAIKIGENQYKVSSVAKSKIYDKLTGKLIDEVVSPAESQVIISTTREGAIKASIESYAASIGKGGTRIFEQPEKLTKKYDLSKGTGKLTFETTETEGLLQGKGSFDVFDIGTLKLRGTRERIDVSPTFFRKQPKSQVMTEVQIRQIGDKVPAARRLIEGTQQFFISRGISDVYPEYLRVKGYKVKEPKIKKIVQPYLRRSRLDIKYPIQETEFTKGIGATFEPESFSIDFVPSPSGMKPSPSLAFGDSAASAAGQAATESLVKGIIEPKLRKPITRTQKIISPKAETIAKTIEQTSFAPSVYAGRGLYERTETETVFPRTFPSISQPSLIKPSVGERVFIGGGSASRAIESLLLLNPTKLKELSLLEPRTIPRITPRVKEKTGVREKERVMERQRILEKQGLVLRTELVQPLLTIPRLRPPKLVPRTPTIKIPKLPKSQERIRYIQGRGKEKEKVVPFIRRRGKYAPAGPAVTFEEAFGLGVGRLRKTLGASLQIRGARTGKLYPIAKETPEFRPGKKGRDIFTLVQRARKRLSSRQERIEIIQSRGKGIKWY